MATRTIKVENLARVEGEGALRVVIREGRVEAAELKIFEPPRFFEAFLRGRAYREVPDITARICGICPVAYQMSAVHALEHALGISVDGSLRNLRRLIYCGEWIESHALHIYLLHAPDFLGYEGAMDMARDHPRHFERGLQLKKTGNALIALLGGREVHPINVRIGGFYKVPRRRELAAIAEDLKHARAAALETVHWVSEFAFPDCDRDYEFVALSSPDEYPLNDGRITANKGIDIAAQDFDAEFEEQHVAHSTALQARTRKGGAYLAGPLARYALNFERLSPLVREAAQTAGLGPICRNPYQSIIVRSLEVLYACDEALRLIENYEEPDKAVVDVSVKPGVGHACTEAPRGLLYHRYKLDADGTILDARLVPPTSQNQANIEEDLKLCVEGWLHLPDDLLRHKCEQVIRNYDPCISCATHFLKIEIDRG